MKMIFVAAALLTLSSPSVFAQTAGTPNSSQMDAASSQNDQKSPSDQAENPGRSQNISAVQQIRKDLQDAGFTDVKVIAESFVVQAKSRDGNPVVMTIGPNGMTAFEAMSSNPSGTVGMGPGGGTSGGSTSGSSSNPAIGSSSGQPARAQQ
jgi:hypothetical protein